ncbi:MAG: helix-turn-helix domain-containing protein [Alloprevotella sp.]
MHKNLLPTLRLCLLFLALTLTGTARAKQPDSFAQWSKLSSKQLLELGSNFAERSQKADSALVCFTLVANRYAPQQDQSEKRLSSVAYAGKWYVYFFHYFDYSKAYENLQRSYEIAVENGDELQRIYLNFGCMYQTIAEQSGDLRPCRQAAEFYEKSFNEALAHQDCVSLDMATVNLCTVSHMLGTTARLKGFMERYCNAPGDRNRTQRRYALLLYDGLSAMEQHQWQQALDAFGQQIGIVQGQRDFLRYDYCSRLNLAKTYAAMGQRTKAIDLLRESERIAVCHDLKDAKLEVYKLAASLLEQEHCDEEAEHYRNKYFCLKDTLLNYRQVASVSELKFLGEIKAMDEQIARMTQQRHFQNVLTWGIVATTVVVLCFLLIVWRKNRKLNRANLSLYNKNIAMLKREEEERNRRKEYEQTLEEVRKQLQQQEVSNEDSNELPKYRGSWLDENDKQELEAKILDIIETTDEIYKPDFSADRLAQLIGINYRYLSQVINERYGVNFNTFINEHRIKEACKRFNQPKLYGNYTIEGIARSVGFSSRSAFFTSFKKFTGLSPSEYQKMAQSQASGCSE